MRLPRYLHMAAGQIRSTPSRAPVWAQGSFETGWTCVAAWLSPNCPDRYYYESASPLQQHRLQRFWGDLLLCSLVALSCDRIFLRRSPQVIPCLLWNLGPALLLTIIVPPIWINGGKDGVIWLNRRTYLKVGSIQKVWPDLSLATSLEVLCR
ncbi:hypothetical protein F4778DRAFT_762432 [Xylariomycetidae sp. FL2044]|nr:hypothetical protein F4778DRAFT_762432 [Xylariomycetidae sp. FL2044]